MNTTNKKRLLALLMIMVMAIPAIVPSFADTRHPFTDVSSTDWYNDAVAYCYQNNLMVGVASDRFDPAGTLTRAQFVTVLGRQAGVSKSNADYTQVFTDVDYSSWYGPYINWATDAGIVNGYGHGKFGPDDMLTKEQLATILYRYRQYNGEDVTFSGTPSSKYSDSAKVSNWARNYVNWGAANEVFYTPDNKLNPVSATIRAESAYAMYRLWCDDATAPGQALRDQVAAEVPSYLVDNTVRVIEAVNNDTQQAGTDSFLFFTDPHVWYNTWSSAKVMGSVFNHTGVKKLICGGDIATSYERSKSDCIASYTQSYWPNIKAILPSDAKHYMVHGNHDYYYTNPSTNKYAYLSESENHYYVMQAGPNQESYVNAVSGKNYYTFRNDTAKIEYIVLDTVLGKGSYNMEGAQIDWLIDRLAEVPAGYSTLVIGHIPVNPKMYSHNSSTSNLSVVQSVLEAYANRKNTTINIWDRNGYKHNRAVNFTWSQSYLIGYMAGHEHADNYRKDNGVNYITVCADVPFTDYVIGTGLARTAGTQSECAVDACVINTDTRTMNLYRIGAGNDLVINY